MSKVNPNEAPDGYVAMEAKEFCDDCAFAGVEKECPDIECRARFRADNTSVIFKKGMTFEEALKLLRQGKEVKRKGCKDPIKFIDGFLEIVYRDEKLPSPLYGGYQLTLDDLNATDWKEYKEDSK